MNTHRTPRVFVDDPNFDTKLGTQVIDRESWTIFVRGETRWFRLGNDAVGLTDNELRAQMKARVERARNSPATALITKAMAETLRAFEAQAGRNQ